MHGSVFTLEAVGKKNQYPDNRFNLEIMVRHFNYSGYIAVTNLLWTSSLILAVEKNNLNPKYWCVHIYWNVDLNHHRTLNIIYAPKFDIFSHMAYALIYAALKTLVICGHSVFVQI